MLAIAFPGQGVQRRGMLTAEMREAFPDLLQVAEAILGYSVETLCVQDPHNQLNRTRYTQPALFVVNALAHLLQSEAGAETPDFAIGHSLGEYNALFAAGAFDFATGVNLVRKRADLMDRAQHGAMAVVMGLSLEQVSALIAEKGLAIDLANINTPTQFSLAGLREDIEHAKPVFEEAGARWIGLPVSGAFHSRYMHAAAKDFGQYLQGISFKALHFPVIANVTAQPHDTHRLAECLAQHLASPVRWVESIRYLMAAGVERFEERGPGKVLSGMIDQIRQHPAAMTVQSLPQQETEQGTMAFKGPSVLSPVSAPPSAVATIPSQQGITPESLGCPNFRADYGLKYAYLAGAMFKGIASEEMVVRLGKAGLMGFFGTGGLDLERVEQAILSIRHQLQAGGAFGMNLLFNAERPDLEMATVDLFLRHGVACVEASSYMQVTPALVRYRLAALTTGPEGRPIARNRVIAKLSRPEIAQFFLDPAPKSMVQSLLQQGLISPEAAEIAPHIALADDLCVEADSAGHTDRRSATALFPAIRQLRDRKMQEHGYKKTIRVGLSGGIGGPEAAAAAFVMGADFILTGSINQCSVEAGNSAAVKDLLQQMDIQDTDYAPAGDLFEIGGQVQVLKRGLLFPARANKLYEIYRAHKGLETLDAQTRKMLETSYFRRSFEEVFAETKAYWLKTRPAEIELAERDPKKKMALVFKWYFVHSMRLALQGQTDQQHDYQIHCSPALGAFNRLVKGTTQEAWQNRHVDDIAETLMRRTAVLLNTGFSRLAS